MANKLIKSTAIYWCPDYDRHILVIKEKDEVVGLNYCQGDDIEYFNENYTNIDYELTDFYNAVEEFLSGVDEIERINQAMWAYSTYEMLSADRASEKIRSEKLKALQDQHEQ